MNDRASRAVGTITIPFKRILSRLVFVVIGFAGIMIYVIFEFQVLNTLLPGRTEDISLGILTGVVSGLVVVLCQGSIFDIRTK